MAHGHYCKNCGRQETEHEIGDEDDLPELRYKRYPKNLEECPGFENFKKDKVEIKRIEKEKEKEGKLIEEYANRDIQRLWW